MSDNIEENDLNCCLCPFVGSSEANLDEHIDSNHDDIFKATIKNLEKTEVVKTEAQNIKPESQIPKEKMTSEEKPLSSKSKVNKKKATSKTKASKNNLTLNDSVADSMAQMFSTPSSANKPAPNFEDLDGSSSQDQSYLNLGIGNKKKVKNVTPNPLEGVTDNGIVTSSDKSGLLKCPRNECSFFSRYHYVLQNHINKIHSVPKSPKTATFPWNPVTQDAAKTESEKLASHVTVPAMPVASLNIKASKKGKKSILPTADSNISTEKNVLDESVQRDAMVYATFEDGSNKPEEEGNNDTTAEMTGASDVSETPIDAECAECSMITDDDELQQHILDKHVAEEVVEEQPDCGQANHPLQDTNQSELEFSLAESNQTKEEEPMETEQLLSEVSSRLTNPLVPTLKGNVNEKIGKKKKLNVTFSNEDSFSDQIHFKQNQKLSEPIVQAKSQEEMNLKETTQTADFDEANIDPLVDFFMNSSEIANSSVTNESEAVKKVEKRGRPKKGEKRGRPKKSIDTLPVAQPEIIPHDVTRQEKYVATPKEVIENIIEVETAIDLSSKLASTVPDNPVIQAVVPTLITEQDAVWATSHLVSAQGPVEAVARNRQSSGRKRGLDHVQLLTPNENNNKKSKHQHMTELNSQLSAVLQEFDSARTERTESTCSSIKMEVDFNPGSNSQADNSNQLRGRIDSLESEVNEVEVTLSEKENQITMLYSDLENKNSQINSLEAQIKSMQERRAADNLMYLQQITEAKNFCLNMYNQLGGLENQLRSGDNSMNSRGL